MLLSPAGITLYEESQRNNNALKQHGLPLILQGKCRENMTVSKGTDLPLWPLTFS